MLEVLITGLVVGLLLWLVVSFVPMPELFKRALVGVIAVLFIIWAVSSLTGGSL